MKYVSNAMSLGRIAISSVAGCLSLCLPTAGLAQDKPVVPSCPAGYVLAKGVCWKDPKGSPDRVIEKSLKPNAGVIGEEGSKPTAGIIGEEGSKPTAGIIGEKGSKPNAGVIGEEGRQPGSIKPTGRVGAVTGMPYAGLIDGVKLASPAVTQPASAKVAKLNDALGMRIEADGLDNPIRLSAVQPYVAGKAFVSSFTADVNTHMNFYGLNGRDQERLVIGFKPARANKPVLISIGVAQAARGTSLAPATLKLSGSGISQSTQLSSGASHINAVFTPADTNWYRIEVSVEPHQLALVRYVELTPVR